MRRCDIPAIEVQDEAVGALLARWLPGREVRHERAGSGVSTPVYRVTYNDTVAWLRLAEEPGERRDAEIRAHELMRAAGLRVPAILMVESLALEVGRSAALTSEMPGVPLSAFNSAVDHEIVRRVVREAGRELARINRIPVRGYGWVEWVRSDDRRLMAEHASRAAWAAEYARALQTVIASEVLDAGLHRALTDAVQTWIGLPDRHDNHLAHGDLDASHIYVDEQTGAFNGLIDFGEIRGADLLYDLGHALLHDGEAGRPALFAELLAGYRDVTPLPDDVLPVIRLQAVAIATRALAIQLGRAFNPYRAWLATRLGQLLGSGDLPNHDI